MIFRYVKVASVPRTEKRGSWMSRNTMALVNPPPLLKSRRSYCDYLWLVKHRERMGKGCSVVWKCLKLRSPPRKSAPPAVPRCDGFTEMQSWKDNYDLRCVHSSKNAVKHSQTRGPKDTIKSNIWMMYIGWNMLKHKGVSRPPRYWSSWRWRQRSVHCQGKHGVHDDLLPSVAICCHLLPSVAICCHRTNNCEILWRPQYELLGFKALGFTASLSAHHKSCSPSWAKWISWISSSHCEPELAIKSNESHRMKEAANRRMQPCKGYTTPPCSHGQPTSFSNFDNRFLPPRHAGDGFWNISCETTTRLRRCFNQTPMSASVASHMWRKKNKHLILVAALTLHMLVQWRGSQNDSCAQLWASTIMLQTYVLRAALSEPSLAWPKSNSSKINRRTYRNHNGRHNRWSLQCLIASRCLVSALSI